MTTSQDISFETRFNAWFQHVHARPHHFGGFVRPNGVFDDEKVEDIDSIYASSGSTQSSLKVHCRSDGDEMSLLSTTATGAIPALTRGSSSASSAGSADTDVASALDGGFLLESRDGVLTVPNRYQPDADLLCPFQILDCDEVFSEIRDFKTHVFSHFKGYNAPKTASCFLCDEKFVQGPEHHDAQAWNDMLSHLANAHFRQGERLATVRTDFGLMRWMYCRRIINSAQFKRTQMCAIPTLLPAAARRHVGEVADMPMAPVPPPTQPTMSRQPIRTTVGLQSEAFTVQASRRAERRWREGTRPMVSARGHL